MLNQNKPKHSKPAVRWATASQTTAALDSEREFRTVRFYIELQILIETQCVLNTHRTSEHDTSRQRLRLEQSLQSSNVEDD